MTKTWLDCMTHKAACSLADFFRTACIASYFIRNAMIHWRLTSRSTSASRPGGPP